MHSGPRLWGTDMGVGEGIYKVGLGGFSWLDPCSRCSRCHWAERLDEAHRGPAV